MNIKKLLLAGISIGTLIMFGCEGHDIEMTTDSNIETEIVEEAPELVEEIEIEIEEPERVETESITALSYFDSEVDLTIENNSYNMNIHNAKIYSIVDVLDEDMLETLEDYEGYVKGEDFHYMILSYRLENKTDNPMVFDNPILAIVLNQDGDDMDEGIVTSEERMFSTSTVGGVLEPNSVNEFSLFVRVDMNPSDVEDIGLVTDFARNLDNTVIATPERIDFSID